MTIISLSNSLSLSTARQGREWDGEAVQWKYDFIFELADIFLHLKVVYGIVILRYMHKYKWHC